MPRPFRLILLMAALSACTTPSDDTGRGGKLLRAAEIAAHTESIARARQDSMNRAQPGYIIDSILPLDEEVRRFQAAAGGAPVGALQGGADSREALVTRFAAAVAAGDTLALRRMAITPREFIDLVYPASPYTKPPYRQSPSLTWQQIQLPSESGLRRLMERHGGRPMRISAVQCAPAPEQQGANRLHVGCAVEFASGGATPRTGQLFGTIIERSGRFKVLSFANMY
ncbi:MAG: hypothetical protein P3B98_13200 [Gemmatimonadota bacterium]|nr:hypothetical protein [Gemmatimonadota bacterium]